ncbi:5'/3'-nucleotidase SurE [Kibdelosporangium phytohabitans]|uniref:5'-nucleotidase n=1 Tax=Kibdelosporangium phytohabitans TaxID=860235 RepID=A0A0N7F3W0_9PSEU|nr:5'/3'-nucleotidase SurE [Kibdelosporangium phytohabitans]ALG09727.1 5'-nucleotidase [Kibdelosporangium phytohabitans]MBE1468910.1 5'-nucleotidase [Kibdelosporangium phytohabitans]
MTASSPRVLVTNDDGIDSPGLAALAQCSVDLGWHTVIAAPAEEASGTSAGLTAAAADRHVMVQRRELPGLRGVEAYAVAAHPAFIVLAAVDEGFGDCPDIVLSGINRGANVGRAILHSGTVGAAMTAGLHGARALAVSLDVGLAQQGEAHWSTAAEVVRRLLPDIARLDQGCVLNLNVPNTQSLGDDSEPQWATLATYGRVQSKVTRVGDDAIQLRAVEVDGELEAGTDAALLAQGRPTVTAIRSIVEDNTRFGIRG